MTREVVIGILKSLMEHGKVDAAEYHALGCAISELETKPSKNGTTAWMDMPESPNDDYGERFKRNVDESLNELNREIMICETNIEMLWDAVEAIKNRLPKEWGK